jgi:lipopolysaccharide heptosyltransferase II
VLIIKPCCIGDVLGIAPVFESVRDAFPSAQIDLLTSSWSRHAAETCESLTQVLEWPRAEHKVLQAVTLVKTVHALRSRRYQVALMLDRSPVVGAMAWLSGIPIRAGYDSGGRGFGLNRRMAVSLVGHEQELATSLLEALGIPCADGPARYRVPDLARRTSARLMHKAGIEPTRPTAVIAPGGGSNPGTSMASKRWSPDSFTQLASRLVECGFQVILVGSANDAPIGRAIRHTCADCIHDLTGRTALPELAAIIEAARLYIGNDSGTTHLAAAVGCPTVAIFGPTNAELYGPRGPNVRIVSAPQTRYVQGSGTVIDPWFTGVDWRRGVSVGDVWAAIGSLAVMA